MAADLLPHQMRVVEEYADLEKKTDDLRRFLIDKPVPLVAAEWDALFSQLAAMMAYQRALRKRLKIWGVK